MTGYLHLHVPGSAFRLVQGDDALRTYQFNTGVARHMFCRYCGIKSFYISRSHPKGISVNARCLVPGSVSLDNVEPFDGENWEANIDSLRSRV